MGQGRIVGVPDELQGRIHPPRKVFVLGQEPVVSMLLVTEDADMLLRSVLAVEPPVLECIWLHVIPC